MVIVLMGHALRLLGLSQWGVYRRLSEEERRLAAVEACRYEALSEEERSGIWNEGTESVDADAEGDEIELPAGERPAR
ncbi:MAG: hypothetical protein ACRERD_27665 [Candidatus Binatia bacterium]